MQLFSGLLSNPPSHSFNVVRGRRSSVHHPTLTSLNNTSYRFKSFPSSPPPTTFFLLSFPGPECCLISTLLLQGEPCFRRAVSPLISQPYRKEPCRICLQGSVRTQDLGRHSCQRRSVSLVRKKADTLKCPINHSVKNISLALRHDITVTHSARLAFGIPWAMQHSSSWIMVAILSTLKFNYLTGSLSRRMSRTLERTFSGVVFFFARRKRKRTTVAKAI